MLLQKQKNGLANMNFRFGKSVNIISLKFVLLVCFSVGIAASSFAQNPPFAFWTSVVANARFGNNWANVSDLGFRTVSDHFTPFQNFIRTGLRYNYNLKLSNTIGIAYFNTKTSFLPENHEYGHEFRIYQEINRQSDRKKKFLLDVRSRFEQRFFSATSTRKATNTLRLTSRLFFGYQFSKRFVWQPGIEYMESYSNKKIGFDQIRFMSQFGIRFDRGLTLNLMYMNIIRKTTNQDVLQIIMNKTIQIKNEAKK